MRNFAYLIGDRQTGDCVVVDPAYAAGDLVDTLEADGLHLSGVLVTHHHPDHVGGSMMGFELKGLAELLERVSVPVHVNSQEAQFVSRITGIPMSDLTSHEHGDKVSVGAIDVELLHTPGHTPGSQCFLLNGRLVAGDTLFLEGCGRTDFPGATPTRYTAACSNSLRFRATRQCFQGIGIRLIQVHRYRRSSVPITCIEPLILISGEC